METLIKNGMVIDGTGRPAFRADVLIRDERIAEIGALSPHRDTRVVDASGLVVSPGFIDTHSHSDLQVLVKPELLPKVMQGITTEVLGQDGVSMAPLPGPWIDSWRKNLAGFDGDSDEIDWNYRDTDGYLKAIERKGPGINVCYLVPHGNIRLEAMGMDNRAPSKDELADMKKITAREIEHGAFGISTGLIYVPCAFSKTEELVEICRTAAKRGGIFVVHQRSEADTILESMREVLEIGRKSGIHVHFSHFKICGEKNWDKSARMLELLDAAEQEGIRVSFDMYPYIAGSTTLSVLLPPWVFDGGTEAALKRLENPSLRRKMAEDIRNGIPGWDNFVDFAGFDGISITSVSSPKNRDAVGLTLSELARRRGKDPFEALFDILYEDRLADSMVDVYGVEENVRRFLKRPECSICTDGLLGGKPHPRVYGAFPRVLGKYVREEHVLSLEEAVHKMTRKSASVLHLKGRGEIQEGNYADLCVFDPAAVADRGTFTDPMQYPNGIRFVFVNGVPAVENGKPTMRRNGKVLRK